MKNSTKHPGKDRPPSVSQKPDQASGFCKQYTHWRSGKVMVAADYGYKAWFFGKR